LTSEEKLKPPAQLKPLADNHFMLATTARKNDTSYTDIGYFAWIQKEDDLE